MKLFFILTLTLLVSFSIFAKDHVQQNDLNGKIGVGFAMDYDYQLNSSYDEDYNSHYNFFTSFPYHLLVTVPNGNTRFEIQTAIISGHKSNSSSDFSSSGIIADFSLGFYFLNPLVNNVSIYVGAKVGSVFQLSSNDNDSDGDIVSTYLTPTVGGEYFFIPNFSISGEVSFKVNILNDDNDDLSVYYLSTLSSLLVKWYF